MGRRRREVVITLDTIWEMPEPAWERLQPLLDEKYPRPKVGRKHVDFRQVLNGIIFIMRTGCQWNRLPKIYGDDSSVHRWFQRWVNDRVFVTLWSLLVSECDELGGVEWKWQAADGCMGKARLGGAKRAGIPPTEANLARRSSCSSTERVARSA